jgi:hypothetical protein
MDYRELLKKYLWLIAESEGVLYVSEMERSGRFNDDEINSILALSAENHGQ